MGFFETQVERADLPLVVVPVIFDAMRDDMKAAVGSLADVARVRVYDDFTDDRDEVRRRLDSAEVGIITGIHFDETLLSSIAAPRGSVKCLAFGGTGVASYVNLSQAKGMGIQVRNIAHYGDASVAEHAIALMLECSRRIGRMDASMKRGEWDTLECIDLHGKTLGLVGFGGISQAVARIAAAIGMRVQVWARPSHVEAVEESGYVFEPDLMSLFAHSDVVSLHVGLNDATAGMITREHLDALRTGSFFINTARSQLVTHGALEQRLERGDIVAGVDVYDQEPLPADDPLRGYDNAILTPHAAWFADTAFANIARQVFADVRDYFQGGTLGLVN